MLIHILDYIAKLHEYLESALNDNGIAFKPTTDAETAAFTTHPHVYELTMPSTSLKGDYPSDCPAIVIRLDAQNDNTYTISLAICISYVAKSDAEIAIPDGGGLYHFDASAGNPDTDSDVSLLRSSIQYTEKIVDLLHKFTGFTIDNIAVDLPTANLPDFPYAVSVVTFDAEINRGRVGQHASYEDLY